MKKTYFISGINTDSGKTIVTGMILKFLTENNIKSTSLKIVQTGCENFSDDIILHRKISRKDFDSFDKEGITSPYLFKFPASPHLSAELENRKIDISKIENSLKILENNFDIVLVEGAGGLYVPLTRLILTIDFIKNNNLSLIFVSSSELGSINHTLMSLELCKINKIEVKALIYNRFPNKNEIISNDSFVFFENYISSNFPRCLLFDFPIIDINSYQTIDFSKLFFIEKKLH